MPLPLADLGWYTVALHNIITAVIQSAFNNMLFPTKVQSVHTCVTFQHLGCMYKPYLEIKGISLETKDDNKIELCRSMSTRSQPTQECLQITPQCNSSDPLLIKIPEDCAKTRGSG